MTLTNDQRPATNDETLAKMNGDLTGGDALDGSSQSAIITPAQFDQALTLDAEDQHVLVKLGPTPPAGVHCISPPPTTTSMP